MKFGQLIILLSKGLVKSVQQELNAFFKEVSARDYDIHQLTSSALIQSRAKLRLEAFVEMNDSVARDFYKQASYDTWKGHRLLGVDRSTINQPSHKSVTERFGQIQVGRHADVPRSMARLSMCYDVLNLLTLDAAMEGFHTSEKALLDQHLVKVSFMLGDILLADRGYASKALMFRLLNMGVHFCFRMKDNWRKEVHEMQQNGETDKQACFYLPQKDKDSVPQAADKDAGIQCRLVILELENGQKEVLCTSLLSAALWLRKNVRPLLKAFDKILSLTTDIVRPDRSFPRKHKPIQPLAMAYKVL